MKSTEGYNFSKFVGESIKKLSSRDTYFPNIQGILTAQNKCRGCTISQLSVEKLIIVLLKSVTIKEKYMKICLGAAFIMRMRCASKKNELKA